MAVQELKEASGTDSMIATFDGSHCMLSFEIGKIL